MSIKRPTRPNLGKPKRVCLSPDKALLAQAAASAVYDGSSNPYHCLGIRGRPLSTRVKPASICPKRWTDEDATKVLRAAVARGNVSEKWEEGFPRYVWHRDGEVFYEARHTRGPSGSFHAYPIEEMQAPQGLKL